VIALGLLGLAACADVNGTAPVSGTEASTQGEAASPSQEGGDAAANGDGAPSGQPADAPFDTSAEVYDPLEDINRFVFTFNQRTDRLILEPAARAYVDIVPAQTRQTITNFLRHLNGPVILANQLLQGDLEGAGDTAGRFFINSFTLGLGDLANHNGQGIPYESEDFGQTLAVWGVGEGPYLILPLLGPSNLRDTVGLVVDNAADPLTYVLPANELEYLGYVRTALTILDARARSLEALDELEASSLDFYAALRAVYQQRRDAEINDQPVGGPLPVSPGAGSEGFRPGGDGLPSADDFTFD
jgi:phospholipid-binding lipoprotein MlaA